MGQIIEVKVDKLKFWLENYRFGTVKTQEEALNKLKDTKNFGYLVASIRKDGFQLNNLLTVLEDKKDSGNYLVCDGNRRLAAIKSISGIDTLQVFEEKDKTALNAILAREHSNDPAGRLKWTSVQQARWETSQYEQGLRQPSSSIICLNILESAQGKQLNNEFPLTTFQRLYDSTKDFHKDFGISDSGGDVRKAKEVKFIIDDIDSRKITSRNINTAENIQKYLDLLLSGKHQDERTNLADDNESEESVEEDEEQNPTRLFAPSELGILEKHIKNPAIIAELRRAPVKRYPHLLALATRSVLDTLRNIDKNDGPPPKSLHKDALKGYMHKASEAKKVITKAENLLDTLCEHAHDLRKKSTDSHIDNNRELVNKLIHSIHSSIKKGKSPK